MKNDRYWMGHALELAKRAALQNEVPVGAVIVRDDNLLGEGFNQPIKSNDPTAHAEIMALRSACQKTENYRLAGSTLYVTLEPCLMCAGAIIHARVERVVFASKEPKTGASGSCFDVFNTQQLNHYVHCEHGLLAKESSTLLHDFFQARR
ncbi:MAG: tRNA adenosine(34) deaminase TadA [Gammaproteobacteria bacterium]|nr:MAG: tRNA adenosine(34) deaminase TadA [Gammaproteobacteria bacterium]